MTILLLYNPISGRGRAAAAARSLADALHEAGHEARLLQTQPTPPSTWLDGPMCEADVAIIVGGDGAVRLASGAAARTGTPVHQLPYGTENLFAREFGMSREVDRVLHAIEAGQSTSVDLGLVAQRRFTLMTSMGLDAEVVHDLAARRNGTISHLSYVMPIVRTALRWRAPCMTVTVDQQVVVNETHGAVIIANSRQYGARLDPASEAQMADGRLDVIFLPGRAALSIAWWALHAWRRRLATMRGVVAARGRVVRVQTDRPVHLQIDGDPPGPVDPADVHGAIDDALDDSIPTLSDVTATVEPGALKVLLPAVAAQHVPTRDVSER